MQRSMGETLSAWSLGLRAHTTGLLGARPNWKQQLRPEEHRMRGAGPCLSLLVQAVHLCHPSMQPRWGTVPSHSDIFHGLSKAPSLVDDMHAFTPAGLQAGACLWQHKAAKANEGEGPCPGLPYSKLRDSAALAVFSHVIG